MDIRLVVTGKQADGKSVFVHDGIVDPVTTPLMPGAAFHTLWGADAPVQLPADGTRPATPTYFPPEGGFRFGLFTLGPATSTPAADLDIGAAVRELQEKLPGMMDVMEPGSPGMHTTDTIDYEIVISGEVFLELDDGAEVHLKPGDCVIQNGTRHRWRNPLFEPCLMAFVSVGGKRAGKG